MKAKELKDWLKTMADDTLVAIDDGGLAIVNCENPEGDYIEVGGIPEEDDDA